MVRDKSGKPVVGAIIVLNGGVRVFTQEGGYFHALLAPGSHSIEAVADGYQEQRQEVRHYVHHVVTVARFTNSMSFVEQVSHNFSGS